MGSMSLLNEMGDLTVSWDSEKDEEMQKIIEKKMAEGIRFFIVKPFTKDQIEVKTIEDISSREIVLKDEDIERLFTEGKVGIFKRVKQTTLEGVKRVKNAVEASKNNTIGLKQFQGG